MYLDMSIRCVGGLYEDEVRNSISVIVGHGPYSVPLITESGSSLKNPRLILRSSGGDMNFNMPIWCVRGLYKYKVGDAVSIEVSHEPNTITFITEGGGTLKNPCLKLRSSRGDVDLNMPVWCVRSE